MDSKDEHDGDGRRNKTAENSDTSAMQKKRARRVSFAEMTSVHFFDRDDESNETSLTGTDKIGDDSPNRLGFGQLIGDSRESGGEEDGADSDDEAMEMPRSFLRPVGSPSPGGSTFGSASSNDEDNFFGPVSAHFIRPGRFSDSGASDDNRDVTMDSATFSMHYRSLVRSDSGVDLKTPTGGHTFFEEKTPTEARSSMDITLGRKLISKSSVPSAEESGSHSSNYMSLVGETRNKYDYERISPGLDALLKEGTKNLLSVSMPDDIVSTPTTKNASEVLPLMQHGDEHVNVCASVSNGTGWTDFYDIPHRDEHSAYIESIGANAPQTNSLQQFSSGTLEDAVSKEDYSRPNRSPYQLSKDQTATRLASSTSPSKQQQLVLPASTSKDLAAASPMTELSFSLLRSKSVERQEIQTSIQKSISKLESLEKSAAFSSAFAAKIDIATIRMDFLESPNFSNLLEKNRHASSINDDSFAEDKLADIPLSKQLRHVFNKEPQRDEILNHFSAEKYLVDDLGRLSRMPLNESGGKNLSTEQWKYGSVYDSPAKITWSGNSLKHSLFTSKQSDKDVSITETKSLLDEVATGDGGKAVPLDKIVSSPGRTLEKRLSVSPGHESRKSEELLLHLRTQLKQTPNFNKVSNSTPDKNPVEVIIPAATGYKGVVTGGMNGEFSPPFSKVNDQRHRFETEATHNEEKEMLGAIDNSSIQIDSESAGNQTNMDTSRLENNLAGEESIVISHGSLSPSSSRCLDEPRLHKNQVGFPISSSSRKEFNNSQSPRRRSPKPMQLSSRLENLSSQKRGVELLLRDSQKTDMVMLQRSPKIQKQGNLDPLPQLSSGEGGLTVKWTDTYGKFCEDVKALICGSANELSYKMIDRLEDRLVHQHRSKKFKMLCHGVVPQCKIVLDNLQLEKMAELNSLLHQVVFQRAKLHLKNAKRESLLKGLQLSSSRIQELEMLRASIALQSQETCTSSAKLDAPDDLHLKKGEAVPQEKWIAMTQELDSSNKRILNLTRTLQSCCKTKVEACCGKTLALVNEHLSKRASCRSIRLDMQIWLVQSVSSSNGHHTVVLNYLDLIIQSITIIVGPTSSVATSFKLIETNITKNFPNTNACVALAFVFSADVECKYAGTKTLAQQTQVTSSILGTLLDVLEELQLSQIEFCNLTQSSFHSSSAEQLDLMLTFFNFNSGKKVTLTLDMSCLKWGIYPSEVVPLETSMVDSDKCSSVQNFDEIKAAVKSVKTGYTRILRLCRCLFQAVEASIT